MVKMVNRKKSNTETTRTQENGVNLEDDYQAIKSKNKELVQKVAKLQQDKRMIETQVVSLQKQYFTLNSKYVNLKNIFTKLDGTVKLCFPKVAEVVQHLAKTMHLCSVGTAISGYNKDPKTQAVTPHAVNGTVIQNPTITLARFSNIGSSTPPTTGNNSSTSRSTLESTNLDAVPSTSRGTERVSDIGDRTSVVLPIVLSNGIDDDDDDSDSPLFVSRHRRPVRPLVRNDDEEEEDDSDEEPEQNNEEYCSPLLTISEEDEVSQSDIKDNEEFTDRVREIRIYLSPLHDNPNFKKSETSSRESFYTSHDSAHSAETSGLTKQNSSADSPNKTNSRRLVNGNNSRASQQFALEDSQFWRNHKTASFTFNISSENTVNESRRQNLEDIENSKFLRSLGLQPTDAEVTTSTPVVQSPRTRSRITQKFQNSRESTNGVSFVSKRKRSSHNNTAHVLVERLSLNKSKSPLQSLEEFVNLSPISTPKKRGRPRLTKDIKQEPSLDKRPIKTPKRFTPDDVTYPTVKRETGHRMVLSIQVMKSSPRPKRRARPLLLKEPSLNKKMRRSK